MRTRRSDQPTTANARRPYVSSCILGTTSRRRLAAPSKVLSFGDLGDRCAQLGQVVRPAPGCDDTCTPSCRACVNYAPSSGCRVFQLHKKAQIRLEPKVSVVLLTEKKAARIRQNSTNLCRRQTKNSSEMFALGRRQVALLTKPSLQFVRLRLGEQHAAFLLVRRNADCWSSAASRRCMRPHIERIRSVGVLGCRAARLCASVDVVVGRLAALWLDGCGVQCGGQLVVSYRLLRWIAAEITD